MVKSGSRKVLPGREPTSREWIALSDLYSDEAYQRPIDETRVVRMRDAFDPDALGLPFVAEMKEVGGSGRFAVIDGQHRVELARLMYGDAQIIECEVIRGITRGRAAELFRLRNRATKPRALDVFLAGVTAGDPECVAIDRVVRAAGLRVARGGADRTIEAVVALQRVYRGDRAVGAGADPVALKRTLTVCNAAWGPNADAFLGDVVHGIGMVVVRHAELLNDDELSRKLRGYSGGPVRLLGDAKGLRVVVGGSVAHAVAAVVTRLYNRGRRRHGLPAWRGGEDERAA